MRLLIFLLALISAFFIPKSFSTDLDYSDLRTPKTEVNNYLGCQDSSFNQLFKVIATVSRSDFVVYCGQYLLDNADDTDSGVCPSGEPRLVYSGTKVYLYQSRYKPVYRDDGSFSGCTNAPNNNQRLTVFEEQGEEVKTCPPVGSPEHTHSVTVEGEQFCAKEKEPEPPCPEPTGSEIWVGGTSSGVTNVCYQNADGSQCNIETDENGSYMLPLKYGSSEPVQCVEPEPEPDPNEPQDPDEPQVPDDSDDPTPTPEPEDDPENKEADDSDKELPIDALNQVNDNLKTINDNMNQNSESHKERLDRMTKETQNSNELLSSVKQNTAATTTNTGNTVLEIGKTNDLLYGISKQIDGLGTTETTEPEDDTFTFTAGRKQGGLNILFTESDLQQVTTEIDTKKTELNEYIQLIQTESQTLFEINPQLSGGYEERKETIKGVEVDLGLARFSAFFQLLAPAILLISTMSALYILLGSNKE